MIPNNNITAKWHQSIEEIPKSKWDYLLGNNAIPFYKWNWLSALEKSQSICPQSGWQPLHLLLFRNKEPIAIAPMYLKSHSYGEFIFDQPFARLAASLNLNYYPKLIGMSPLSPIEGYRFFFAPNEDEKHLTKLMMDLIDKFAINNGILSVNFLYVDQNWSPIAKEAKCSEWLNKKSIWIRKNEKNFSDYLQGFNANQRRNIIRERKSIKKTGLNISVSTGESITEEKLLLMYNFYKDHCAKWGIWGSKYLSQSFFKELASLERKNQIVLFTANNTEKHQTVAMSMCVTDGIRLWGRYWGSLEEIKYLHFELCYYAPIDWALQEGIKSFDPGAGGNHKYRRGFMAKSHSSLHRWYEPQMDKLIRAWMPRFNETLIKEIDAMNNDLPFEAKTSDLEVGGLI